MYYRIRKLAIKEPHCNKQHTSPLCRVPKRGFSPFSCRRLVSPHEVTERSSDLAMLAAAGAFIVV